MACQPLLLRAQRSTKLEKEEEKIVFQTKFKSNNLGIQTSYLRSLHDAIELGNDELSCAINNESSRNKKSRPKQFIQQQSPFSIKEIVKMQLFEGYWDNDAIVTHIFEGRVNVATQEDKNAAITYLILIWIEKYHPEKEYTMIIKKTRNWLKKQKRYTEFPSLFDSYLK